MLKKRMVTLMNKIILKAVNNGVLKNPSEKLNDTILTGIITYKYVAKMASIDRDVMSMITGVAEKYAGVFKETVAEMKNTYVSYMVIMSKLDKYGLSSLLDVTDSIIDEIYKLYLDKTLIKPFSVSLYSPNIYSISDLTWEQNERLRNIHYSIMVPIAQYYMNNNNLSETDMKIYSGLVFSDIPGKGILFSINGISLPRIMNDLKKPSIGVWDKLYKASTYENMILLIIR